MPRRGGVLAECHGDTFALFGGLSQVITNSGQRALIAVSFCKPLSVRQYRPSPRRYTGHRTSGPARRARHHQLARSDDAEARLRERLSKLNPGSELRRIDVAGDTQARTADAFVALRPNGEPRDPEQLIEGVLFGSGRHIYVVPESAPSAHVFNHVLLAWNGSRKAARALAEGMPYFRHAQKVTVLMVIEDPADENQAELGHEVVRHLLHHGIHATLHHSKRGTGRVGETLIAEAARLKADLLVMGAYGMSRLREWLLGGTTYKILHESPIPLLMSN